MTSIEADICRDSDGEQPSSAAEPEMVVRRRAAQWLRPVVLTAVVAAAGVYFYRQGELTEENMKQIGAALPAWLFFPAYFILPLFGFPISIVLLASGLKYGFAASVAIAAAGMAFHTFCAWHIAHGYFRQPLESWLSRTRFDLPAIPERHQIWFTALFVSVPGLPYAVKLYSLALTNLPFCRYVAIVWFFHVLNSILFIGLGAAAGAVDSRLMLALGGLAVVMCGLTYWAKKRLGRHPHRCVQNPEHE